MRRRNALRNEHLTSKRWLPPASTSAISQLANDPEIEARVKKEPHRAWTMHPVVKKPYKDLPEDKKDSNQGAARRIPDHLGLIDFEVVRQTARGSGSWKAALSAAIKRYRDPPRPSGAPGLVRRTGGERLDIQRHARR